MEEKVAAERLFRGRKDTYPSSVAQPFQTSRLGTQCTLNALFCYVVKLFPFICPFFLVIHISQTD